MTTSVKSQPPLLERWRTALVTGDVSNFDPERTDAVTKWLIITRASVFSMTFTSGLIGALLAAEHGKIAWLPAILSVLGVVIAHASNNILNDYTDYRNGIDTENYPRTQYGIHPILGGLVTPNTLLVAALIFNLIDAAIMVYLAILRGPAIIAFAVSGLVLSLAYTGFLKRFALGELTALIVWGPLMIGGTAFAAAGEITPAIWLSSLPYGLIVASVLIGKHTDKITADEGVGVKSVPVLLGEKGALLLNKIMFITFYVLVIGLVTFRLTGPWVLLSFLAIPRLLETWKVYSEPKPATKPEDWPVWPLWYVGWAMFFNRRAGEFFILGLILNIIVPKIIALFA
ncbi:MAG: prenyltransferase [Anaerolineales bacterium]|nr:prenyltransferase [Anaerolineales bacterium]